MIEVLLYILKDIISGLIWGYAAFKFTRNIPDKDEVRITALMFVVGCLLGVIPTVIIFIMLVSERNTLKIFQKKPDDIINESEMELEELYEYQKRRAIKKSLKYFVCIYVVVLVCAFVFGVITGLLEYIDELNSTPNYQIEQHEPTFEYL